MRVTHLAARCLLFVLQVQVWLVHILATYLAARCFLSVGAGAGVVGAHTCYLPCRMVLSFRWPRCRCGWCTMHILATYLAARCFLSVGAGAGVGGAHTCYLPCRKVISFRWRRCRCSWWLRWHRHDPCLPSRPPDRRPLHLVRKKNIC